MTKEELVRKTINAISENNPDLLNTVYVSLISADSNTNEQDRKDNLETLNIWLKILPKTNLFNKGFWEEKLKEGIEILEKEQNG